jgi:integrase
LLKPALDALKEQYEITGANPSKKFDFTTGRSEKLSSNLFASFFTDSIFVKKGSYFSKNSIAYGWKRGTKLANIRERNPYQSRHTYACWTLMAGANPSFIASQMGHEDARMVYEVYSSGLAT